MAEITWVDNLTKALGRKPTLDELLEVSQIHHMTPTDAAPVMGAGCEHGELDFEQCPKCRNRTVISK